MNKLTITIAKGEQAYGAWIDSIPGIYGQGDTVEEAKRELNEGLNLFIKHNKEIPDILRGDYETEYQYDVPSFLEYYSGIFSKSAMERLTGVNQKQLFHYVSGRSKPSKRTVKKIDNAFRRFTSELSQVHFV
ncbi:MAG: type II toxin-antitoxin system HicB family antitoxin [Tannerella sp.]|jgi:predicted RNase H-like HicB family nuclease|nr:type II toxin-antitoxin system HicB family antitoxin [Tannerella sp.]